MSSRDEAIGQAVATLRGEQTQQAVADAMRQRGWKWSQATVWSVEKGERPLRLAEAEDLAAVLGSPTVSSLLAGPQEAGLEHELRQTGGAYYAAVKAIGQLLDERDVLAATWAAYVEAPPATARQWVTDGVRDWLAKPDIAQEAVKEAYLEREIEAASETRRYEAYRKDEQSDGN